MYLLDRNNMGLGKKFSVKSLKVTNEPNRQPGNSQYWNLHGSPVVWPRGNQMLVYIMGEENPVKQFTLVQDTGPAGWRFMPETPVKVSKETAAKPPAPQRPTWMPGGFLTISANGSDPKTGVLWATMPFDGDANHKVVRGALRAFDASDVSKGQLWGSEDGDPKNNLGLFAKYTPPVVWNGKVYVAAFQEERVEEQNNGTIKLHFKDMSPNARKSALAIYGLK